MLGDYDVPVMYQDLGNYTMNPFIGGLMPMGCGMYPSYLGDVRIRPLPERDMVELMNKKNDNGKENAKLLGKIIGAALLVGFIPYIGKNIKNAGGISKFISNGWTKLVDAIKKIK